MRILDTLIRKKEHEPTFEDSHSYSLNQLSWLRQHYQ
jgi:hypothetical protein